MWRRISQEMPGLPFDKFIAMLFILLGGVGVCLTWPAEVLLILRAAFSYVTWGRG
jgi:hypothetical protein